jgi:hypothetical protein
VSGTAKTYSRKRYAVRRADGTWWRDANGVEVLGDSGMVVDLFVSVDLGKLEGRRIEGSVFEVEAKVTSHFDLFIPYSTNIDDVERISICLWHDLDGVLRTRAKCST